MQILHICFLEKFIPGFIELVRNEIKSGKHIFLTFGSNHQKYKVKPGEDVRYLSGRFQRNFTILSEMKKSDAIILHGLIDPGTIFLLLLYPYLRKKCYWVMWGGDMYGSLSNQHLTFSWRVLNYILEKVKHRIIPDIGYLLTYIRGDLEYVRAIYGAKGRNLPCNMYDSNTYKPPQKFDKVNSDDVLRIQVGNSADPTNNHLEVFTKIKKELTGDYIVYVPLSYGKKSYADEVINKGKELFGEKLVVMQDFMSLVDYTKWQQNLDIAIFAHRRQQAMGNIITLLGLGKTIFMWDDVSSTDCLRGFGLTINSLKLDRIARLEKNKMDENIRIIKGDFSRERLIEQWEAIFSDVEKDFLK